MKHANIFLFIAISLFFFTYSSNSLSAQAVEVKYIHKINISGNKQTRERVVLNELTFQINDSINSSLIYYHLEESKKNLLKTNLFNKIDFSFTEIQLGKIIVHIELEERWYLWPTGGILYADRNLSAWLEHKDLNRVMYGIAIEKYNFLGLNQKIKIKTIFGFENHFALYYSNIFLDKKRKHAVSFDAMYMRSKNSFYDTQNNKLLYYFSSNNYIKKNETITATYQYRQTQNIHHEITLKRINIELSDSIIKRNSNIFGNYANNAKFFEIRYFFIINKKDNNYYPLDGYYFKIYLQKQGILFRTDNINNFTINLKLNKYFSFSKKIFFATSYTLHRSLYLDKAYYFQQALGYEEYIRGYENYVIDGVNYSLNKNSLKYKLFEIDFISLKIIPIKQFQKSYLSTYINLNFDIGYSKTIALNDKSSLQNSLIYGYGIGLDFETYYDTVFRIEYTVNKQFEHGFYFNIYAPI